MRVFLQVLLSVVLVHGFSIREQDEWNKFKATYKKQYDAREEERRMKIFFKNKAVIEEHNKKYAVGLVPYDIGMNHYGDLTQEEFERSMLGIDEEVNAGGATEQEYDECSSSSEDPHSTMPSSWMASMDTNMTSSEDIEESISREGMLQRLMDDVLNSVTSTNILKLLRMLLRMSNKDEEGINWVKNGAVTPPRDQGQCGSCWAFSAIGALEGQLFRKTGTLEQLSVQHLVDCTRGQPYCNLGCRGGNMVSSFVYIREHGVTTEKAYPYKQKDSKCRYEKQMVNNTCRGFNIVSGVESLMKALRTIGPVSVVLDASSIEFRFYKRGVYVSEKCSTRENLNHAVLAVGYGSQDGRGYWLVKNSWGTSWGEDGFFRISRDHACGINHNGIYPIV